MDYHTLSEILKCGVCKERLKQPKTLECNHTFCMNCIDETHRCRPYTTNDAKCPMCRRRFVLTYGGAAELPDNFHVKELLDRLEIASKDGTDSKTSIPCQKCSHGRATSTCLECYKNLCENCVDSHSMIPDATDHHIFKLSDMNQTERETLFRMAMVTAKCTIHNLFPSRYSLNKTCMKLVCPECCLDDHKLHELQNLSDCASLWRDKLKRTSEKALRMEVETKIEIDRLNQSIADKTAEKNAFKNQISFLFDDFREKITNYETTLLANGIEKFDNAISKLEGRKTESTNVMANMAEITQNVTAAQKIGTNAFLVSEQHHLESWLQEIENDMTEANNSEDNIQIEIIKETSRSKISQGEIYQIKEKHVSNEQKEELVDSDHGKTTSARVEKSITNNCPGDMNIYENARPSFVRPKRTKSVLSLPLPSPPVHSYERQLSFPDLKMDDAERTSSYSYFNEVFRHDYPTRLTFDRRMHINVSSMISGLTVTRDNEIVAVLGNEKKVSIFKYNEKSRSTTVCYDVKRNWIQPWDAAASYDDRRNRTTVYVTDSDNNQGYIVCFEIKRSEIVKTKTLISSRRLQPKGIATRDNEIFVCDSEQRCVIVYGTNGQFKRKIGLSHTFTHPMYISRVLTDRLLISDDVRGSIIQVRTNGEFESETSLGSNSVSQLDTDIQGTVFVGDFKMPVLHALIDNNKYKVEGDFSGMGQTTAISVDNQNRIIVGHSKGIEVLQVNYRYGDHYY